MADNFDILLKNCVLRNNKEGTHDIAIKSGKINQISRKIDAEAKTVINAEGNLVTESYANPHLHLCKVYTLMMMDDEAMLAYQSGEGSDMGGSMTGIELAARVKEKYDEKWIIKNVRKALALAAKYGCLQIRALADVDNKGKLEGIKALLRAREEFKDILNIQVCAFAQDGIVREPGAETLLRQSMDLGADVVGGIPWIEYTDADIEKHVKICYDIAEEYKKPVSMLVDDAGDPGLRSIELMATESIKRGMIGKSLAHHARAMALYPTPYLKKLAALLKQADMGVVSDPHTGPLHARVRELLNEGVLVCLGQDDISDAYYPYGRNNMLEVAFLVSHLLWMTSRSDMEQLYELITTNAAKCMGIRDHKLEAGANANLVVLTQPNVLEALRYHEAPSHVISKGKLIDQEKMDYLIKNLEWS